MNRLLTLLALLFLASLACSMPANSVLTQTPNAPKPAVRNTPNALVTAEVTATSLHVRTAPMGLRVGYLYSGDVVTLTNKCSDDPAGWAQIRWQGRAAWVNADYLSDNKCKE